MDQRDIHRVDMDRRRVDMDRHRVDIDRIENHVLDTIGNILPSH